MPLELDELLADWGFANYLDEFLNYGLDNTTILYLDDEKLERIFNGNLGKVIKFKLCVSEHISKHVCIFHTQKFLHIFSLD